MIIYFDRHWRDKIASQWYPSVLLVISRDTIFSTGFYSQSVVSLRYNLTWVATALFYSQYIWPSFALKFFSASNKSVCSTRRQKQAAVYLDKATHWLTKTCTHAPKHTRTHAHGKFILSDSSPRISSSSVGVIKKMIHICPS